MRKAARRARCQRVRIRVSVGSREGRRLFFARRLGAARKALETFALPVPSEPGGRLRWQFVRIRRARRTPVVFRRTPQPAPVAKRPTTGVRRGYLRPQGWTNPRTHGPHSRGHPKEADSEARRAGVRRRRSHSPRDGIVGQCRGTEEHHRRPPPRRPFRPYGPAGPSTRGASMCRPPSPRAGRRFSVAISASSRNHCRRAQTLRLRSAPSRGASCREIEK